MKTLVLGSNGYAGALAVRLLARHPEVASVVCASRSDAGSQVSDIDPGLEGVTKVAPTVLDPASAVERATTGEFDTIVSALPHGASADVFGPIVGHAVVLDLSADFRFDHEGAYNGAYGTPRPLPEHQERSAYGLAEFNRSRVSISDIIALPGCYPTASLLALLPLRDLIVGQVVITALSGVSGAGRSAKRDTLFGERSENMNAYRPGRQHRHTPEICEKLSVEDLLFVPHLVPLKQGELVTAVVKVTNAEFAIQALQHTYESEQFVSFIGETPPQTRHVRNTNRCRIGARVEGDSIVVMSAIDNLWKGAAGQAIQCMNIRFGFDEAAGLESDPDL